MKCTFYLKEPKSEKESLILFSCYFKKENRKFVYSTGETIRPIHWDPENKKPVSKGKNKTPNATAIKTQLGRYESYFYTIESRCININEDFTSEILKKAFDKEFKHSPTGKNIFFNAYDTFIEEKMKNKEWTKSTEKRYNNLKNILQDFEKDRSYKLTFHTINAQFHSEFTDYCMSVKGHINNTYSRNLGLFKTFMYWALDQGYTYNDEFRKFKRKERVVTNQIALKKEDLENLMKTDMKSEKLERVRDVFVFACITGLRFGELKFIRKSNVIDGYLHLKEEKGVEKEVRTIPLNEIAMYLLRKYDYRLPLITNQKQNEYIKQVFKKAEYTHNVEKVTTRGKEVIREAMPFYERISTHTARRTFITMLKRDGKSDKLISKITGHKDLKTLNQYYQVDDEAKREAVEETFNIDFEMLKKV